MLRRHPITFIPIFVLFVVLMGVPVIVYFIINTLFPSVVSGSVVYPILVLSASIYALSMYLFFYVRFIEYYLDLWVITNDRLLDMEQQGLFSRSIKELDLYRIQDVTVNIQGIFSTLLNYGNIHIKTASTNTDIVFHDVSHPDVIQKDLIRLSEEDRKYHQE